MEKVIKEEIKKAREELTHVWNDFSKHLEKIDSDTSSHRAIIKKHIFYAWKEAGALIKTLTKKDKKNERF